jgi:hypothetical protein
MGGDPGALGSLERAFGGHSRLASMMPLSAKGHIDAIAANECRHRGGSEGRCPRLARVTSASIR